VKEHADSKASKPHDVLLLFVRSGYMQRWLLFPVHAAARRMEFPGTFDDEDSLATCNNGWTTYLNDHF
jgi:hypothetical protein